MRTPLWAALALAALLLGGCGMMSSLARGAQESGQLQQRTQELEEKLELAQQALESYGPLAEDLGPEIKEKYQELLAKSEQIQGYVAEGKELLGEAVSLHQRSMEQATDPESGETDWLQYALLMLAGGGGLYSERRRTKKEQGADRSRLHARMDKRKQEAADLAAEVMELKHQMDLERARREAPAS